MTGNVLLALVALFVVAVLVQLTGCAVKPQEVPPPIDQTFNRCVWETNPAEPGIIYLYCHSITKPQQ